MKNIFKEKRRTYFMKKFLGLIFAGAMIFGGVGTVQALDIQPRGPQLDPVTKSTTKDCKAGSLRLFTLTHSAYFVPNTLGTQCSVQNHKIGAKNISSKITGNVVVSKTVEEDGFVARGRGYAVYKGKGYWAYTKLEY